MTQSHWTKRPGQASQEITTDIVIVGAGFAGLSVGYWLSEMNPDLKITIADRAFAGAGASGRNAGFLTKGSAAFFRGLAQKWGEKKALAIHQFASESLELAHKHILVGTGDVNFESTSSLTLVQDEKEFNDWKAFPAINEKFNFHWKEKIGLPDLLQHSFIGGFESKGEFKVQPVQVMASLKKKLESRKIIILENSSVFEMLPDGVVTENNRIKAHQIVLALNGYSPQFSNSFKGIIAPKRAQMLAVEIPESINASHLFYDPSQKVYWRQDQEKVIVIGGKRLLDEDAENGDFEKISPAIQGGLESYLRDKLQIKYKVLKRWSGIMGFTEHELPLLQRVNAPCETFVLGGFSGHGMGFGFKAGLEMAEIITGKKQISFFQQFRNAQINL